MASKPKKPSKAEEMDSMLKNRAADPGPDEYELKDFSDEDTNPGKAAVACPVPKGKCDHEALTRDGVPLALNPCDVGGQLIGLYLCTKCKGVYWQ